MFRWIAEKCRKARLNRALLKADAIAVDLIAHWEGFRATSYQCGAEKWTIGYGTTQWPDNIRWGGGPVREGENITEPQARELLKNDAGDCVSLANLLLGSRDPGELAAVGSLIYNTGLRAVRESRFLKAYKRGDMAKAKLEFLDFNRIDGVFSQGLQNRRNAEWKIFTGEGV